MSRPRITKLDSDLKMLLQDESLRIVSKGLSLTKALGLTPWILNVKTRRMRVVEPTNMYFYWHAWLNQFLLYWTSVASLYPLYLIATSLREAVSHFVFAGLVFAVITLMSYTYATGLVLKHRAELASGFNTAITFIDTVNRFDDLPAEEAEADLKLERDCRRFLKLAHRLAKYFAGPVFCVIPIVYMSECFVISAEMVRPIEQLLGLTIPMWMQVAGFVLGLPFYWYLGLGALWFAYVFVVVSFPTPVLYEHIFRHKLNRNGGRMTTTRMLGHPKNAMVMHKGIYIGVQVALGISSNVLPICHFMGLSVLSYIVYCVAGAKAEPLERLLTLIGLGFCGFYGTFLMHMAGQANELSVNLLDSWRLYYNSHKGRRGSGKRGQFEIERKTLRSLVPIRIYSGSLYYFNKTSSLTLWHQAIDKSIVLLSAFPFPVRTRYSDHSMTM